jgi:hypothetical protein
VFAKRGTQTPAAAVWVHMLYAQHKQRPVKVGAWHCQQFALPMLCNVVRPCPCHVPPLSCQQLTDCAQCQAVSSTCTYGRGSRPKISRISSHTCFSRPLRCNNTPHTCMCTILMSLVCDTPPTPFPATLASAVVAGIGEAQAGAEGGHCEVWT